MKKLKNLVEDLKKSIKTTEEIIVKIEKAQEEEWENGRPKQRPKVG